MQHIAEVIAQNQRRQNRNLALRTFTKYSTIFLFVAFLAYLANAQNCLIDEISACNKLGEGRAEFTTSERDGAHSYIRRDHQLDLP